MTKITGDVVAERLSNVMNDRGIGSGMLSYLSGVHIRSIHSILNAESIRVNKNLYALASALNVDPRYFFDDKFGDMGECEIILQVYKDLNEIIFNSLKDICFNIREKRWRVIYIQLRSYISQQSHDLAENLLILFCKGLYYSEYLERDVRDNVNVLNSLAPNRLQTMLRDRKLSKLELAKMSAVEPYVISNVCNGRAKRSKELDKIAYALEINPNYLFINSQYVDPHIDIAQYKKATVYLSEYLDKHNLEFKKHWVFHVYANCLYKLLAVNANIDAKEVNYFIDGLLFDSDNKLKSV